MDYRCAKFDDFSFSHFGLIVWKNTQTLLDTLLVGVSNALQTQYLIIQLVMLPTTLPTTVLSE